LIHFCQNFNHETPHLAKLIRGYGIISHQITMDI
jgi:hypothetical protein